MASTEYTVSQISGYIKNMFAAEPLLNCVTVCGEISNCRYHYSGHIYFTIKDENAAMSGIMFSGDNKSLKFRLEEGMKVKITGNIAVYEKTGKYELYARHIEQDGQGNLYVRFEMLKEELRDRGMFSAEYKQNIPRFVTRLGIVTASTGAAIRDIISVATRRNPYIELFLYPAQVQGIGAAETIVKGIETLDSMGLDCIIVGRGGGSIEDLWAFNEEIVAQAIFDCDTPVISAVGHETDFTIADFVADMRAATPSAAAEMAVFDYMAFLSACETYKSRIENVMYSKLDSLSNRLSMYRMLIERKHPSVMINERRMRLDALSTRLENSVESELSSYKHKLLMYTERLKGCSPLTKISSGYAFVTKDDGSRLKSVKQVAEGDKLLINISDGRITAVVTDIKQE